MSFLILQYFCPGLWFKTQSVRQFHMLVWELKFAYFPSKTESLPDSSSAGGMTPRAEMDCGRMCLLHLQTGNLYPSVPPPPPERDTAKDSPSGQGATAPNVVAMKGLGKVLQPQNKMLRETVHPVSPSFVHTRLKTRTLAELDHRIRIF